MSKEIYISSTPHETRLAIVENDDLTEIYYERENEYTLAGSIYNGKVTRVLPGMQSSFVDIGLERDAFLYITDFMEEAGDTAEFDSGDSTNGARRGGREDRSSRPSGRDETPIATGDTSSNQDRPAAAAQPESRSEREGGRRRRSNRDARNGGRDGRVNGGDAAGSREQGAELRPTPPSSAVPLHEAPGVIDSGYIDPRSDSSSAELGEGAPGADGSRRWRGRRGRRRGRSAAQREESQVLQQPENTHRSEAISSPGLEYQSDPAGESDIEEDFDREYTDSFDLDASAATPQLQSPPSEPQGLMPVIPSVDHNRRDRGDREPRSGNRRDRSSRDQRGPRAPRGFTPSRALYGVETPEENSETGADGPASEPMILPGESLSKYRKGDESTASASQPVTPALRPPTEFTLPGTWDGGNVLPGETIRPRQSGGSTERSGHGDGGRVPQDRRDGRGNRNRSNSERTPVAQSPFRNEPASADHRISERGPQQAAPLTEEIDAAPSEASIHPAPEFHELHAPPVEEHPVVVEYEPVEGSASVRFDSAKVSEYRQSAPVAEDFSMSDPSVDTSHGPSGHVTEEPAMHSDSRDIHAERSGFGDSQSRDYGEEFARDSEDVRSSAHTITPQPDATTMSIHTDWSENSAASHEFTAIQNTGEMISASTALPEQEVAEPTSPLHHESAVFESLTESELSIETTSGLLEEGSREPKGSGVAELHASSIEEMDYGDEDEETLEGAADLGTMIREMSIDQITRPGEDPEDDEDIVEEEYAMNDHHSDIYEESEETEEDEEGSGHSGASGQSGLEHESLMEPQDAEVYRPAVGDSQVGGQDSSREPDRRSSRRDGRRDGRRESRGRDRGGERARSTGGSGDRSTSRPGRRDGRHSAQMTNLPAISDLLKPGQEVLVQIAKEPIAKKGARITSHIALPGRFLVFMPTVNHTGVSRKIESDSERRRLKEILLSEKGEASGGFIVRTAASGASEEELRSDLRFLLNLWADIKQRSESSKSPALIYHDLNLVERVLRDQVTDTFSAIWVDTETEYERVLRFLQRFQPSLIRRVKLYTKETPLFEQFGITEEINKALRSKVWLKSGGSIVINQTEALVAIDINTGKYVGKTARLEDTIVKTNLDAIPEIVRQIRLRDLGGIIIIDFIDMDERKNRHKVMAALEEELKTDRAPSKVLQFNDFGLVAITRKRVKQSLERTLSTTCNVCQGTGMTKSPVTVCNDIYVEIRKMQKHLDRGDVMLRVHPEVVKQLKAGGTKWLQEMEEIVGKTILVKSDPSLHPEQFDIH